MPTITFLLALLFASFAPAATKHHSERDQLGKVTTKGKPNNGDFVIANDIMP